jgi:hypothetical protein
MVIDTNEAARSSRDSHTGAASSVVVFEANALWLRPQGGTKGKVTLTSSQVCFCPHENQKQKYRSTLDMKFLLARRYLLQSHVAVEIFYWSNASPFFLVFETPSRCTQFYQACRQYCRANWEYQHMYYYRDRWIEASSSGGQVAEDTPFTFVQVDIYIYICMYICFLGYV